MITERRSLTEILKDISFNNDVIVVLLCKLKSFSWMVVFCAHTFHLLLNNYLTTEWVILKDIFKDRFLNNDVIVVLLCKLELFRLDGGLFVPTPFICHHTTI